MAANPNPALITDAVWQLWEQCQLVIPGVKLGGIYANKSGYHNTVQANKASWPGTYSIKVPLDLNSGPQDKARAIDLTMSDIEMRKRTGYLKAAALHVSDDRLHALREFIGTLDSVHVYCLIENTDQGDWVYDGSRGSSHLWHIHLSIFTHYCASWIDLEAVLSVLSGETWEDWLLRKSGEMDYFVIRDAGPYKDMCGRAGGGTFQFAPTLNDYTNWRTVFPGPERVITHAQFNAGVLGVDIAKLGSSAPVPDHTHTVSVSATTSGMTTGK